MRCFVSGNWTKSEQGSFYSTLQGRLCRPACMALQFIWKFGGDQTITPPNMETMKTNLDITASTVPISPVQNKARWSPYLASKKMRSGCGVRALAAIFWPSEMPPFLTLDYRR